jgi:hypothetical protein
MKATKTKPIPVYGDDLPITTFQKQRIMQNCQYNLDIKSEWVQWVTEDVNRISLSSITQAQAVKIIKQQTGSPVEEKNENWGFFDKENRQHKYILSILRTANIVVKSDKWGEVPDTQGWLNRFLKSPRSPVKKPLKDMSGTEVSKIIKALENVSIWKNTV